MSRPQYFDCGCCGQMHHVEFNGDCRNNEERFIAPELDSLHGVEGWDEVEQPV